MEGKNIVNFKSQMDAHNARVSQVMKFAHTVSSATIKTFMVKYKNYTIKLPNNFQFVDISPAILAKLSEFNLAELHLINAHAKDVAKVTTVSTFNVESVCQSLGYVISYEKDVGADRGATLVTGADGSKFPESNEKGYALFDNKVDKKFYCPINGQFINTNFFREARIEKMIFNHQLADAIALLATFFSLSNGRVKQVVATEAGTQLLNFDKILSPAFVNSVDYVSVIIEEWLSQVQCPDSRGWKGITLHSLTFAHHLYTVVSRLSASNDKVLSQLASITDLIAVTPNGRFFDVASDNLVVRSCPFGMPKVLNGQVVDLRGKSASLDQAYYSLMLARSMRGVDKSERGGLSRKAYIEFTVSPSTAEILYTATNIQRFIHKPALIFRTDVGKSVGSLIQYLNALIVLDYDGVVVLPQTTAVKNVLLIVPESDLGDVVYRYLNAKYKVVLSPVENLILKVSYIRDSKKFKGYVPNDAVIFDLRLLSTTTYDKRKFMFVDSEYEAACENRCYEYSMLAYPVVFRCPTFRNMFVKDKFVNTSFVTGVELHNLVQWGMFDYKPKGEAWWYDCDANNMEEICAASIITNIGRCVQAMIRVSPRVLLSKYGFKVPKVYITGIKRIIPAQIAYTDDEILAAVSQGSAAIMHLLESSDVIGQANLMSIPLVQEALNEKPDFTGASVGRKVIGLEADDVFDDDLTNVDTT